MSDLDAASHTAREALETAKEAKEQAELAIQVAKVLDQRQSSHEEQCAERYAGILQGQELLRDDLKIMRGWILGALATAVITLIGAAGTLFVMWITAAIGG